MEQNELEFVEEDHLSIQDYIRILLRSRWIIVGSFVVVLLAALYISYTATPVYEAVTSIMIDKNGAMERTIFDYNAFGNQNTLIANQMEIIKSRHLAERVARRLDLSDVRDSLSLFQPNEDGEYRTLRSMAGAIRGNMEVSNKRDTDIIEIKYRANSRFEAAYIANAIAEEFRLSDAEANRSEISDLRVFLEKQLRKKGEELRISEERLKEYKEAEKVASLDEETNILVTRISTLEAMLEEAQIGLQSNQEMKSSLEAQLEERKQTLSSDLSEISTPYLQSLQQQYALAVAERTKFQTAIEVEIQGANKRHFESQIKQYDDQINALKRKLEEEAKKISSSSMIKDPFQLSQELITKLLTTDTEIKTYAAKINSLQDVVDEYARRLEVLPEKVLELARLERQRRVDEQTYMMMTQKLEETKIQEQGQSRNVRIVDPAIEPGAPVSPKKKMNVMLGALLGLGLGVGLAFMIEYFDNTVKTPEDIQRLGFNTIVTIPKISMDKMDKKLERKLERIGPIEGKKIESRLITHLDPKSPVSESYRTLRTNLQFSKVDQKLKSILVTSSGPKEGKSTTAANLAIAMAQAGNKVILIDADLRRPVVHSIFGMDKEEGLTNYFMGTLSYKKLARKTIIENLSIITSGVLPPNPSELLASKKMQELLHQLQEDYDVIVLDSPPIIAVTDAAIISTKVDGTILVVSSGQTNRDAIQRASALLENVNSRILGILLNGVDLQGMYGSYYYNYYYHYYYNYYSKPGKKRKRSKKY